MVGGEEGEGVEKYYVYGGLGGVGEIESGEGKENYVGEI